MHITAHGPPSGWKVGRWMPLPPAAIGLINDLVRLVLQSKGVGNV
ncbi:hypothetical protein [Lacipirellula limnantheis]|uniref:Uncharacterized protein n=1 Tax=Lacipirellula limnantheis TaxID=2528024 RepID=A0A517U576_9BACT|nr:hypothetical protein [Lacipirellula limnantheis]QDT75710.1 hypothetical protein I41_49520 [Lacipirellula limnantheis]